MKSFLKLAAPILLTLPLSACFEVEDNNNNNADVVAAIDRQNQILEENNNGTVILDVERSNSVLTGTVRNLSTDLPADANVSIKFGTTWSDPVATIDGVFELVDLAPNSNYQLRIESPTDAFLPRIAVGRTRTADSANTVFEDLGPLSVAEGVSYSLSVLDIDTGMPIENLEIEGTSDIVLPGGVRRLEVPHVASYNSASGTYDIVLPEDINLTLLADLDVDNDGERDFTPLSFSSIMNNRLLISSASAFDQPLLLAEVVDMEEVEPEPLQEVQLRVSVIDENTVVFENITVTLDSTNSTNDNDDLPSINFDADTGQYVVDAEINNFLRVLIPAFEHNDINYASSSVSINRSSSGGVATFSINSSNAANNSFYRVPVSSEVINIVIEPRATTLSSFLEVVAVPDAVDDAFGTRIFYSNSIDVPEGAVKLYQEDVVSVTVGTDSDSDFILPGFTEIRREDIDVGANFSLSLNDTLLSLSPANALSAGTDYRYDVETIIDEYSQIESNLLSDRMTFSTPVTAEFDIADVVLDNNSFTTNGVAIVAANSAGTAATPFNRSNSSRLYFPTSVENLENFTISVRLFETGTNVSARSTVLNIVVNGVINLSQTYAYSTADNEQIICRSCFLFVNGTTLTNGSWYSISPSFFESDHTATDTNRITFEYVLERKNGDIETGPLVLEMR